MCQTVANTLIDIYDIIETSRCSVRVVIILGIALKERRIGVINFEYTVIRLNLNNSRNS